MTILAIQNVRIGRAAGASAPAMLRRHVCINRESDYGSGSFHDGLDIDSIRNEHRKLPIMNVTDPSLAIEGLGRAKENSLGMSSIQNEGDVAIEERPVHVRHLQADYFARHGIGNSNLLQAFGNNFLLVLVERIDNVAGESCHRAERGDLEFHMLPSNSKAGRLSHHDAVVHNCRDVTVEVEVIVRRCALEWKELKI